jgi:membrane associated rhomboid family serine protease
MGIVFLLIAGPRLERLYGSVKFIYLFLLPGCIVFPFQHGTIVELLSGCICGIMGIYLGLTLFRKGRVSLKNACMIWGCFSIYLGTYYYKIGSLFNPFPLIIASVIGLLFSVWIKFRVHEVK